MTTTYLPAPLEVRELLEGLLGKGVTVGNSPPLIPTTANPASIGIYVDDTLQIIGVAVADLAFSAYAAGALSLTPMADITKVIERGILDEPTREALYEILNIGASMFNAPGASHVKLHDLHPAGDRHPAHVQARALTLGKRLDLGVEISGYGPGRLSLVLIPG